ncbi:Hint domain-containing protein [Capnocytophaga stomatis]|uniref:Hint domain-containing protein n=1 Tax=Capnocytophaga stomatis TaxID=1848904 RepID=UPI0038584AB8
MMALELPTGEFLEVTPEHRFYHNGEWIEARSLKAGDLLHLKNGDYTTIISIENFPKYQKVYNFDIADNENYYVAEDGILVHNGYKLEAGTPEHKAQRWESYQRRQKKKGKPIKSYEEWSNRYEANIKNPKKGKKSADEYHNKIGWGEREVPVKIDESGNIVKSEKGIPQRRLDIADIESKKAIEVKDYSRKNLSYSDDKIKKEIEFDKKMVEKEWDVEWVFIDRGPSKPLAEILKSPPPIKIKIIK